MSEIISFLLLFITPFVIAPIGTTAFENPKVIFAEGMIILLLLVSVFSNKILVSRNRQTIVYALIILLTLIHLVFFKSSISLFGNEFRNQGIFLFWTLLIFSYLAGKIKFEKVKWWIFAGLLIIESIVMFFLPLNESQRYVGTVGEPNALATFAVFVWPFGWFFLKKKEKFSYLKKAVLFLPVIIILYFSGSKSGMIAFAIQILFLILDRRKFEFKKVALVCLTAVVISYAFPYFQKNPYENRTEVWRSAIGAGQISPFLGNGFGNMDIVLHKAAEKIDLPIQYYYFDSSHNIFLDWWVQGGIIGLVLISILVITAAKGFINSKNEREFILFLGVITCLSFNPTSVGGLLAFWWLIGRGFVKDNSI